MKRCELVIAVCAFALILTVAGIIFIGWTYGTDKIGESKGYFPKGALSHLSDMDKRIRKRRSESFKELQEPSIYELSNDMNETSYRFFYSVSQAPDPIVVRISISKEKESGKLYLIKGQYSKYDEQKPDAKRQLTIREKREIDLTQKDILEFYEKLNNAKFWDLEGQWDNFNIADGTDWFFEGAEKGKYKAVSKVSPHEAQIIELGEFFIKLAGLNNKHYDNGVIYFY